MVKTSNNPRGNESGYTLVSGGWLDVSENATGIEIKHRQEGEAVLWHGTISCELSLVARKSRLHRNQAI